MSWLRKAAGYVVRSLSLTSPQGWYQSPSDGFQMEPVGERKALALSAVWGCINLISGSISSLPVRVMLTDDNGSKHVAADHPLHRVIGSRPNFDQTALDFWDMMSASIELQGNAFARKVREGSRIVSLDPISAPVVVRRLKSGELEYSWTQDGVSNKVLDVDVFHIRGPGGNPLGGHSVLRAARDAIGTARAAESAASSTFSNGLRPSGTLTFEKWLSAEQRKAAEEVLAAKYIGAAKSGKPLILEGGTKWTQLTITPEDAQMLETRRFSVTEICRFFGVPPHMIGHTEKTTSWGNGIEQQTLGFVQYNLRRRLKRIEQAIEQQLFTASDRSAGFSVEFNLEGLLRGDSKGRSQFYREMTSIGAMTINEVRRLEGLPAVPGGDVPRMQMQNIPITDTQSSLALEADQ